MRNDTWVKLYRKIVDSDIFENPGLLKFWIWCLCKASVDERVVRVGTKKVELQRGQFVFGRSSASVTLKMAESTVYKYLGLLERDGMISTNRNNRYTIVTIEKWGFYQNKDTNRNRNNNRSSNRTVTETKTEPWQNRNRNEDTNKNVENVENVGECKEGAVAPTARFSTNNFEWNDEEEIT